MSVVVVPPDPDWPHRAEVLSEELESLVGPALLTCHHIGSTAVLGLPAKPIIDLIPEVTDLKALDPVRPALEAAGYEWMGEHGLPGRRYLRRVRHGRREVHCHAYAAGDPEIARHLAFRDHLRRHPADRDAYAEVKRHCAATASDTETYCACKDAIIKRIEAQALEALT